jgi:hypothetical protein
VPADDPETAVGHIIELVKTRIPKRFGLDPIPGRVRASLARRLRPVRGVQTKGSAMAEPM